MMQNYSNESTNTEMENWQCPQCGSENRSNRQTCWRCGAIKGAILEEEIAPPENVPPPLPGTSSPDYVRSLEERVRFLEQRLTKLEAETQKQSRDISTLRSRLVLPNLNLLSDNFLTRAFAVWGHYFVANLIIAIPFICLGMLIN